jgi:hypothetical protein
MASAAVQVRRGLASADRPRQPPIALPQLLFGFGDPSSPVVLALLLAPALLALAADSFDLFEPGLVAAAAHPGDESSLLVFLGSSLSGGGPFALDARGRPEC